MGVTSNVLVLNLGYDVTVKLLSIHLLLISLVLLIPDLSRIMNFFVLGRAVAAPKARPLFRNQAFNKAAFVLQVLLCVFLVSFYFHEHRSYAKAVAGCDAVI